MLIKEFCRKYNVAPQSVYEKIHRHEYGDLYGHIVKLPKQSLELDEFAVEFLKPRAAVIDEYKNQCLALSEEVEKLKSIISIFQRESQDREKYLRQEYENKSAELKSEFDNQLSLMKVQIDDREKIIAELRAENYELQLSLSEKSGRLTESERSQERADLQISDLKDQNIRLTQELNTIQNESEQKSSVLRYPVTIRKVTLKPTKIRLRNRTYSDKEVGALSSQAQKRVPSFSDFIFIKSVGTHHCKRACTPAGNLHRVHCNAAYIPHI